jgi:hypothetical protein
MRPKTPTIVRLPQSCRQVNTLFSSRMIVSSYDKFLKQIQQVSSDPSVGFDRHHSRIQRLPFRFIIPHELISAHSNVHSDFLKLCPSAKLGMAFSGSRGTKAYRQPAITYVIRIARIRTELPKLSHVRSDVEREIIVMPYTLAIPPLQMEYFPREYVSSTARVLKQHRWSRSLGMLNVSATEPPPLNMWTSAPRATTLATLKLNLSPLHLGDFSIQPHEWKFVVNYHLRSRTFYSTQKLDRIPTMAAAKHNHFQQVRVGSIRSEVREIGTVPWKIDCRTQSSDHDNGLHIEESCIWAANLTVPISAPKSLLPTFFNQLSARQYAIFLGLSIGGIYHGLIELILPVQVVFHPPQGGPGIIQEESRTESLEPISLSDLDRQNSTFQVHDTSPPSYD